jgi:hypothetical protein
LKKGQVTVFIIIGIIILIIAGLLFFFRSELFGVQLDVALEQDRVSGDALVVQEYVSSCLQDVSIEALQLLGQGAGYINLSRQDIHNRQFIQGSDPTSSDYVSFAALNIPYWWYEDSEHACVQCSITTKNMPTLDLMETQVAIYVEEHLDACLGDFVGLEAQGFTVTPSATMSVDVEAVDEMVYVQLSYPLSLTKEASTSSLGKWYVDVPVPLENIYEAASEIMYMQIADQFLEQITLNIISAYSGLDEERLPPFAGFTEGYVSIYWVHALVQEQLQSYLNTYIPLIQIEGSQAAVALDPSTNYGTGFFTMLWRESTYPFGDIDVNFVYDDFDYYLDVRPRSGEVLKPSSYTQPFFEDVIPPIQTNHYNFYYDVSFPVVVSLRADDALYGNGYVFLYGLESNLRDNRNLVQWSQGKGTTGAWSPIEIGLKESVVLEVPIGFDDANNTVYQTVSEPDPTLICDATQRLSGDVSVTAYDGVTAEPLPSASVAFRCGNYRTCSIGSTDVSGKYVGKYPVCVGGVVRVDADGYFTNYVALDTLVGHENNVIALLEPFKEVPVTIKFIPTARLNESMSIQSLRALAFDIGDTDSVLLTLQKETDGIYDTPYSTVISVSAKEGASVPLVSGTYSLNGVLLDEEGVVIPARFEKMGGEEIGMPEEDMEIKPAMLGGVTFDAETGYLEVDAEKLHGAEEVVFYLFRMNDPYLIEDLAEMGQFGNYSMVYREVIEPNWE